MAQHWGSARQSGSGERRLAEEFDLALSGARSGGSRGAGTRRAHANAAASAYDSASDGPGSAPAAQLATLVAVAQRVERANAALPGMDEAFRAQLRERLVRLTPELATGPAKAQVPAQRGGRHAGLRRPVSARPSHTGISAAWRRRLLAAGVGVAVATGSVGGIAIASAGAVPGDPLYSAKKMFENIQLSLSGSPTDRGGQYLHLADIRLSEIDALLSRRDADVPGSPTAAYLDQALTDLQTMIGDGGQLLLDQVRQHGDEQALHALSDFLLTERQRVVDLTWQLPLTLQKRPAQIVALMDDLYRQLQQAAAAMPHPGAAPTPSSGIEPGGGTGGGPGAAHGSPSHAGQSSAAHSPSAMPSGEASSSPGASPSAQPSASATPTIGVQLPLPILPSTGINLPPLLPGLPGIDLGLGGSGSTASPTD
ncbi:MAG TPA: DUF5667 domain-containing protein [Actinocrinis sp.]|uniref:DUF5667 domain-containing protein n=1 Tax=Actinocrinis sp. TaxID=1920516 RepID=UPI002D3BC3EC|nr:DUF5667 domain-containing protein [Actinocrinis sp.]HZU59018.1 DUF5667 domain-containing protein [Actinocrinis sp.]